MAIVTPWQIYPRWVWIVRFLIFALAAAIIALAAYAIHVSKGHYNTLPSLLIFAVRHQPNDNKVRLCTSESRY